MSIVSLNPGPLFNTPGFNQTYTPVGLAASERDIKEHFQKEQFSKRYDWPPESPVAEVYDIQNSPAKMVLLNNRAVPRSASHLRGQTDRVQFRVKTPNPERHSSEMYPKKNPERHLACKDSSSPRFVRKPKLEHMLSRFSGKSTHNSEEMAFYGAKECHSKYGESTGRSSHSPDATFFTVRKRQPRLPISMQDNKKLLHSKANKVNASYLLSIAQVYDVSKEKEYKQLQYKNLMVKELLKGFHKEEEFQKYLRYLEGPRKRPFSSPDPSKHTSTRKHSPKRESSVDRKAKTENEFHVVNDVKKNKAAKDTTTNRSCAADSEKAADRDKHEVKRQMSRKRADKDSRQQSEQKTNGNAANENCQKAKNDRPKSTEKTRKIRRKKSDETLKIHSAPKPNTEKVDKSKEKNEVGKPQIEEKPATAKKRITFLNEGTESSPVSRIDYTNSERDKKTGLKGESVQSDLNDAGTTVKDESVTDDEVSSTGQSISDPETFTLQGPEGTTRPKSRLGNRPLLTNEEYMKLFGNRSDDQQLKAQFASEDNETGSDNRNYGVTVNKSVGEEKRRVDEKTEEKHDKRDSAATTGRQDTKKELLESPKSRSETRRQLQFSEEKTVAPEVGASSRIAAHKDTESDEDDYRNGNASSEFVKNRERSFDQIPETQLEENKDNLLTEHKLADDETKRNETWEEASVPGRDVFIESEVGVDREKQQPDQDNSSQSLENLDARRQRVAFSPTHEEGERSTENSADQQDAAAEKQMVAITSTNDPDVTGLDMSAKNFNMQGNQDLVGIATETRNAPEQEGGVNTRDNNSSREQYGINDGSEELHDGSNHLTAEIDTRFDDRLDTGTREIKHELEEGNKERETSEEQAQSPEMRVKRESAHQEMNADEPLQLNQENVEDQAMNKPEKETGTEKEIKPDAEFEKLNLDTKYDKKELEIQSTNEVTNNERMTFNNTPSNERKANGVEETPRTFKDDGFGIRLAQEESVLLKTKDEESDVKETSVHNDKGTPDAEYTNTSVQKEHGDARKKEHYQLDEQAERELLTRLGFEEYDSSHLAVMKAETEDEITDLNKEETTAEALAELEKSSKINDDIELVMETKRGESTGSLENVIIEKDHERTDNIYDTDETQADGLVDDDGKLALNTKSESSPKKTEEINSVFQCIREDNTEVQNAGLVEVDASAVSLKSHSIAGEEVSAAETAEKFVKDIIEQCSTEINSIFEQQTDGNSLSAHSVGDGAPQNTMNNTENVDYMRQEGTTVKMTKEKMDVTQNHPNDESVENGTNSGIEKTSGSPDDETLTFQKTDKQSESDSDRDFAWMGSREGTTRPKSRLGNRASLSKEIQPDDDEQSSASSSQMSTGGFGVRSGYIDESRLPNMDTESSGSSKKSSSDPDVGEEKRSDLPASGTEQGGTVANIPGAAETEVSGASLVTDEDDLEDDTNEEDTAQVADEKRPGSTPRPEQTEERQKLSLDLLRSVLDADTDNTTTSGDPEDKEVDFDETTRTGSDEKDCEIIETSGLVQGHAPDDTNKDVPAADHKKDEAKSAVDVLNGFHREKELSDPNHSSPDSR